jgi:hypothetical protein
MPSLFEHAGAVRAPGSLELDHEASPPHLDCSSGQQGATNPGPIVSRRRSSPATSRLPTGPIPTWHILCCSTRCSCTVAPSPLTRLHRSIARRYTVGPEAALAEVDALATALDRYHLYHATRADLLRTLGRADEARAANRRVLELTAIPAEQALLRRRIDWDDDAG